jgi:plastocyanin
MKLALFLFLIILIAGCTPAVKQGTPVIGGTEYQPGAAAPSIAEVSITNFAFMPESTTVKKDATVTWTNEDSAAHTVVSSVFDSPSLGKGQTFSHTFDTAGTYSYHCSIHPSMQGTVIVVD